MRNLFAAVLAALTLSASAQSIPSIDLWNAVTGDFGIYYVSTSNLNGDVLTQQMSTNNGGYLEGNTYPSTVNVTIDFSTGEVVVAGIGTFGCETVENNDDYNCWYQYRVSNTTSLYLYGNNCSDIDPLKIACACGSGNNGYNQGYEDGLAAGEASCPEDLTDQLADCSDANQSLLEELIDTQQELDAVTLNLFDVVALNQACQSSNSDLQTTVSAQGQQIAQLEQDLVEQADLHDTELDLLYLIIDDIQDECDATEDALTASVDSLQALLDAANATIAGLYEVNADLAIGLGECEDYTDWADQTISNLQTNLITTGNDLAVWQAAYQTQSDELDSLEAINGNLAAENAELAADLYECQTDLGVTEGQLDACADNLQDWQSFTQGLQVDLIIANNAVDACEAVNDSLLNELASLTVIAEDCAYNYGELTDVLNDTLAFYDGVLVGAGTAINELTAEVEDLEDQLADALAESDTCFQEYSALDDQFIAAVEDYELYIDSLNAIISAVPATIESIVGPLNEQLEAAQACCSSCPAAIETAVANAYEQGLADCADDCNESCLELLDEAYNGGVADGISYYEDEVLPQVLEERYWLGFNDGHSAGYQAGLDDCEGSVSGLVDIDGTVINVIGYYNEMGQVIDPARTTGVIIRRHEDGTFSKYIKTLR